jgi:hypothetical protein
MPCELLARDVVESREICGGSYGITPLRVV